MHISLSAEKIFNIGNFSVTNSLLASVLSTITLTILAVYISKKMKLGKSRMLSVVEMLFSFIIQLAESIGGKSATRYVPLVLTFFLYILVSNWLGLFPGFGSIGFEHVQDGHHQFVPILRGSTADLNTTLALGIISVLAIQYYGFKTLKLGYLMRFFNYKSPINLFTGILELISDIAKIISFSFRLFGNVFAGEVLLVVISTLVPVIAPLPFYGLEVFVGLIQALVFSMLTLVFIQMGSVEHGEEVDHGN